MIYDQSFNMSFQQKMETIQYNTALAITGAIRGDFWRLFSDDVDIENFAVSTKY